jgi:GH35 family endo-1,4-beta-xylanase
MYAKRLYMYLFLIAAFVCPPCYGDWKSDANARIESIRKRNAEITVVDVNGQPVPGISVQMEQVKHRFGFGTCLAYGPLSSSSGYRNFVLDHFEWAVCENEMKWASNESTRDVETYTQADYIADWCADNDIVLRGHNLVWETGSQTPSWVSGLPCATYPTASEMLTEIDERINSIVGRYAGQIVQWDVDNEMLSGNMFDCLGEAGRAHFFQQGNSIDPDCGFYMNEYSGNSFGGYDGDVYAARANGLISLGAPVEGLGIQAHINSPFQPENYYNNVLNELDNLGLPIIATEFDTDATTATAVADDLENFYRLCFSHPSVEGIIMWGCEQSAWRWDGIVNSSTWVLNEAGVRYESLLNEWTTSDSNYTNVSGSVNFRGFHGTYEITLSAPGQTSEIYTIELEPGSNTALFVLETDIESPEPDYNAPTPDPMTWASFPTATGSSSITMTAKTATDATPPVQYYFECTSDGDANSSWQTNSTYVAKGLNPSTLYTFRVKARDSAVVRNETGWSPTASATTAPPSTDVEIIGSWATGLSHTKENGTSRALIFIAHAERTGAVSLNSVKYGGKTMAKVIDKVVGTTTQAYVAAYILDEAGVAAATTSGTFEPNWGTTSPDSGQVAYASVFLQNVNQTALIGAYASSSTAGSTPNPITTSALSTNDGDMVIDAATCGNGGTGDLYTVNNGFTEALEHDMTSSTGVDGYKSATGANETPSVTHDNANRQVLIGFVVKAGGAADLPPAEPTELTATAGNETVTLNWNDNGEADLDGYNVYRSTTQGSGYGKLNVSIVNDSNYTDNTVTNSIPYFYVVTAVDNNGHESGNSDEATATPTYQTCADIQDANYGLLSDLDGDCYVNYKDLKIITDNWLRIDCAEPDNCEGADFEPTDGVVDLYDFSDFAVQWLQCNNPEDTNCPHNW